MCIKLQSSSGMLKQICKCEVVIQYKWWLEGMIPCCATWVSTGYLLPEIPSRGTWVCVKTPVKSLHQVRHVTWRLAYLQMNWGESLVKCWELDGAKKELVTNLAVCKALISSETFFKNFVSMILPLWIRKYVRKVWDEVVLLALKGLDHVKLTVYLTEYTDYSRAGVNVWPCVCFVTFENFGYLCELNTYELEIIYVKHILMTKHILLSTWLIHFEKWTTNSSLGTFLERVRLKSHLRPFYILQVAGYIESASLIPPYFIINGTHPQHGLHCT